MRLMHRFGSRVTDEYIEKYYGLLKGNRMAGDEVWFATKYGFPQISVHEQTVKEYAEHAQKFKELGVKISLQLSNSIGHGDQISSYDCSGLVYQGSPVQTMVGHDGTVAKYSFCFRDKFFIDYTLAQIKAYMALEPDTLWIDDDFRPNNHQPVTFGCFCDNCMKEFNQQFGLDFTREQLITAIQNGDLELRKNFIDFTRKGLYDFALAIAKTVKEHSPNTTIGLQHAVASLLEGGDRNYVFNAILEGTGKTPKSRPGGGAYNDHNPLEFRNKTMSLNYQNAVLADCVKHRCPEIESLPFVEFGKTAFGTAFETALYFANGNTDMTYSMAMEFYEQDSYYKNILKLLSSQRAYYDKMAKVNEKSYQAGIRFYISENIWQKPLKEGQSFIDLNCKGDEVFGVKHLLTDGFPISYDQKDQTVIALHPETASVLSKQEIDYLLTQNVFTDGESIEILTKLGVDLGVTATKASGNDANKLKLVWADSEFNQTEITSWKDSYFTEGKAEKYYLETNNKNALVLSTYNTTLKIKEFTANKDYPYGIAGLIIQTGKGGKWYIDGYSPWKGVISSARRNAMLKAMDYICGYTMPALFLEPIKAQVMPRKDSQGKTVCVSIANYAIGPSGDRQIIIRNPKSEKFTFISQYGKAKRLKVKKVGRDYIVCVPSIQPYSVCTIFCD